MTARTGPRGAADRECLVLQTRLRRAAKTPDAHSSQMRFVLRFGIGVSVFFQAVQRLALSRERRLNTAAIYPDATAPLDGCSAC